MKVLNELAERRRFGMKLSLEQISEVCGKLGDPQLKVKAIHIAGTNGKGAVAAMLGAALDAGRYTSPHLVSINERFFSGGSPIDDATLEAAAEEVMKVAPEGLTFFEALTAVAFLVYSKAEGRYTVLETGLGGRFDATNICSPVLSVITRVGLDHCDWLGSSIEKIADEKAGIIKPGVPVVVGRNDESVIEVLRTRAREAGSELFLATDLASEDEIPGDFPLKGRFNRENALTAIAALKVLSRRDAKEYPIAGICRAVWPGRFHELGRFIVDGAHNPPAAKALCETLGGEKVDLIAGFCADKDVEDVIGKLKGNIVRAWAVKTNNPRSIEADRLARLMQAQGLEAEACGSLGEAMGLARETQTASGRRTLVCGSLFLAGEALVELGAYPWGAGRGFDPAEGYLQPT